MRIALINLPRSLSPTSPSLSRTTENIPKDTTEDVHGKDAEGAVLLLKLPAHVELCRDVEANMNCNGVRGRGRE